MENDFLREKGTGILAISVSLVPDAYLSSSGIVQNFFFFLATGDISLPLFFPLHWILLLTAGTAPHPIISHPMVACCKDAWRMGGSDPPDSMQRVWNPARGPISRQHLPPPMGAFPTC